MISEILINGNIAKSLSGDGKLLNTIRNAMLTFWKQNGKKLPKLAETARKTYVFCVTSVSSESSFSLANYIQR